MLYKRTPNMTTHCPSHTLSNPYLMTLAPSGRSAGSNCFPCLGRGQAQDELEAQKVQLEELQELITKQKSENERLQNILRHKDAQQATLHHDKEDLRGKLENYKTEFERASSDLCFIRDELLGIADGREPYNGNPDDNTTRIKKTSEFLVKEITEAHWRLNREHYYAWANRSNVKKALEEYLRNCDEA
jgi:hypothetical protein